MEFWELDHGQGSTAKALLTIHRDPMAKCPGIEYTFEKYKADFRIRCHQYLP
jgi:hypothetical protein